MYIFLIICNRDNEPPLVSITNPSDNDVVEGTVEITADATDNKGINHVDFYIDAIKAFEDSLIPYCYSWNTDIYSSSSKHVIQAHAYDFSENENSNEVELIKLYILCRA